MQIREFQKRDEAKVVSVMAAAFEKDALYRYFIEDAPRRQKFLEKFMRFRLKIGCKHGKVFVSDDCEGVAVWLAPGYRMRMFDVLWNGGMTAMMGCTKAQRDRILHFNDFADREMVRQVHAPYWHLSPICVAPAFQGKGYGRALIERGLEFAGGDNCCLETQSERNVRLYEACDFTCLSRTQVPAGGLEHCVMAYQKD